MGAGEGEHGGVFSWHFTLRWLLVGVGGLLPSQLQVASQGAKQKRNSPQGGSCAPHEFSEVATSGGAQEKSSFAELFLLQQRTWPSGPARALLATPPPSLKSSRFAGMEAQLGSSVALARAVGKRFRGCRAKRLKLELELRQSHVAQKPVLRGEAP